MLSENVCGFAFVKKNVVKNVKKWTLNYKKTISQRTNIQQVLIENICKNQAFIVIVKIVKGALPQCSEK